MTDCLVQNCPNRDTLKCPCTGYVGQGNTYYSNNSGIPFNLTLRPMVEKEAEIYIPRFEKAEYKIFNKTQWEEIKKRILDRKFKKSDIKEVGLTRYNSYNCCIDEVLEILEEVHK